MNDDRNGNGDQARALCEALGLWQYKCPHCKARIYEDEFGHQELGLPLQFPGTPFWCPACHCGCDGDDDKAWKRCTPDLLTPEGSARLRAALRARGFKVRVHDWLFSNSRQYIWVGVELRDKTAMPLTWSTQVSDGNYVEAEADATYRAALAALEAGWLEQVRV
jgi:hypothetical protein